MVEQQIGRVDRVGSRWAQELEAAVKRGARGAELPRIEIRPVIFRGTYDEQNWRVLRDRWDDLRAQLHGIVVRPELAEGDAEGIRLIERISKSAPDFSP